MTGEQVGFRLHPGLVKALSHVSEDDGLLPRHDTFVLAGLHFAAQREPFASVDYDPTLGASFPWRPSKVLEALGYERVRGGGRDFANHAWTFVSKSCRRLENCRHPVRVGTWNSGFEFEQKSLPWVHADKEKRLCWLPYCPPPHSTYFVLVSRETLGLRGVLSDSATRLFWHLQLKHRGSRPGRTRKGPLKFKWDVEVAVGEAQVLGWSEGTRSTHTRLVRAGQELAARELVSLSKTPWGIAVSLKPPHFAKNPQEA